MSDPSKPILNYSRQSVDREDIQAVTEVLSAPFLTTGPGVEAFETALCRLTGAGYAVACSSGTAALHLACMALGIGPGDIGVTSPISFLASANCMEYCGARADFTDIDHGTLCLSPRDLEAYCRENRPPKVYEMHDPGYNYRITDIQCALGISQLKKLPKFRARRQQIVSRYNRAFRGRKDLAIPPRILETDAFPHLYPLEITISSGARAGVYRFLKTEARIHCQVHYIPIYLQPYYTRRYGYERGKCPRAEAYYSGCLSLPLFPDMTDDDVRHVISSVFAAISSLGTDT